MAHERQGDTVEELEGLERMLEKRISELESSREMLVNELRLVREKKERLVKGGA